LTWTLGHKQTEAMAHIYMLFAFAQDEEKAQQARHKLETWKQAFRLDKKLLYKIERLASHASDGTAAPAKAEKAKGKGKATAKGKAEPDEAATAMATEDIRLLVRLGFSGHEKLSEERWLQRIPAEEPFRDASPVIVKQGEAKFEETEKQFDELD
jgi:DNA primase catalytic subunit